MVWWAAETCDPYDLGIDLPPEARQVGREYFLVDPEGNGPEVLVDSVHALHPEIDDEEWEALMFAAADRDDSPDPLRVFHAYRRRTVDPSDQRVSTADPEVF